MMQMRPSWTMTTMTIMMGGGTGAVIDGRKSAEDGNQPTPTPPKVDEKNQNNWGPPCHRDGGNNVVETKFAGGEIHGVAEAEGGVFTEALGTPIAQQ